jgi:hypothetical protein
VDLLIDIALIVARAVTLLVVIMILIGVIAWLAGFVTTRMNAKRQKNQWITVALAIVARLHA